MASTCPKRSSTPSPGIFQKSLYIMSLHSKYRRFLTSENFVSFTFRSRRPFHPAKLHAALNRATASLKRGEGFGSGASATKKEKKSKKSKRKEKEETSEDGERRRFKARESKEEWERKANDGLLVCTHVCFLLCVHSSMFASVRPYYVRE